MTEHVNALLGSRGTPRRVETKADYRKRKKQGLRQAWGNQLRFKAGPVKRALGRPQHGQQCMQRSWQHFLQLLTLMSICATVGIVVGTVAGMTVTA